MIEYTIQFELAPERTNEFSHSWKCFCDNVINTEGLKECKMSELGDNYRKISMTWTERFYLNLFMEGDWYTFLHGAVSVLGDKSVITQKDIQTD